MELRDRTVMILGGSGLVGQAVARRVLAASPRRVVLVALFEEEVQAAAASLEPHRGRAAIAVEWGDVFLPAALAKLGRGTVIASAEHRAVLLHDLLSELTEDTLGRSFLAQLLMKYRPDAVVDSINTATAFAYQDVVQAARELLEQAAQETADRAAGAGGRAPLGAAGGEGKADPARGLPRAGPPRGGLRPGRPPLARARQAARGRFHRCGREWPLRAGRVRDRDRAWPDGVHHAGGGGRLRGDGDRGEAHRS